VAAEVEAAAAAVREARGPAAAAEAAAAVEAARLPADAPAAGRRASSSAVA